MSSQIEHGPPVTRSPAGDEVWISLGADKDLAYMATDQALDAGLHLSVRFDWGGRRDKRLPDIMAEVDDWAAGRLYVTSWQFGGFEALCSFKDTRTATAPPAEVTS